MNNSFARLIDGMCATLRTEVLTRLEDEFARGQVFGVINLLNTFKVRADWSPGFLAQQIAAQCAAFRSVSALLENHPAAASAPALPQFEPPAPAPIDDLLAMRDEGNLAIAALLAWLAEAQERLSRDLAVRIEERLRDAMRTEIEIELRNSPRPLFAEMSSGREP